MDPIRVGINEDVLITKAALNDKQTLEIEFSHPGGEGDLSERVFDQMLTAGVVEPVDNSLTLRLFGPRIPAKEDVTREAKIQMITGDINRLRNQMTHILEQFMTLDQIDLNQMEVQFQNTGITDAASFDSRILDQDILNRIYDNLCKRFIELISPLLGNHEPVRLKLVRQSKDRHWAVLPSKFLSTQPFIELMSVPKEQSRLKFSAYEIREGLDNGDPISQNTAEEKKGEPLIKNPFAS